MAVPAAGYRGSRHDTKWQKKKTFSCQDGRTCCRGALALVAGGAQLEAAHLQHLAAALPRGVQADALKGALALHRPLRRVRVVVPEHGKV